jgi:hypothetical protein
MSRQFAEEKKKLSRKEITGDQSCCFQQDPQNETSNVQWQTAQPTPKKNGCHEAKR